MEWGHDQLLAQYCTHLPVPEVLKSLAGDLVVHACRQPDDVRIAQCRQVYVSAFVKSAVTPCTGADSSSATSEAPCVLWHLNVHHRVHNSPPPSPVQSHMI